MPPESDPLRRALHEVVQSYRAAPHRWRTWGIGLFVALGIAGFLGNELRRIERDGARFFTNATYLLAEGRTAEADRMLQQILRQFRLSSWVRSGRAHYFAGVAAFSLQRYPEAAERFDSARKAWGGGDLKDDAALGYAAALEAQGRTAEAAAAYREGLDRHADSIRRNEMRLGLARCLEAEGNRDEAAGIYRDVAADTSTFLREVARTRLRRLEGAG